MIVLEKCSLLGERLGRTSECYIEVEQKRGGGGLLDWPQYVVAFTSQFTFGVYV